MKYLLYILFLFVSFSLRAQKICIELAKQQSSVSCLQIKEPVCGCNGITYPNMCVSDKSGVQSFVKGRCPKSDSVFQGNTAFLAAECLNGTPDDSIALKFSSDSLYVSGHLKLAFCQQQNIYYSISQHEIVFFQDSTSGNCSDSCTRKIGFALPIRNQNWYHVVFAKYIDTVLYFSSPSIVRDTIDFTFGSCIDTAKQQRLTTTYQDESLSLSGITHTSCCTNGKATYTVFRSTITLQNNDTVNKCSCQCMYLFNCKIPNILPGLYRIKGYGFDTLVNIHPSATSIENFTLSTDSLTVKKDQNSYFTIKTATVSGFKLQNDNTNCVEAKLFGNDVVLRGLKAGIATIRISNTNGYEQSCLVIVEENQQTISLPDSANASVLNSTIKLNYQVSPQNAAILWQSTNKNVASVDANGVITIVSNGTTKIIANILNTAISDTCILKVTTSQSQIFTINSQIIKNFSSLDTIMTLGETRQLSLNWFDQQQMQTVNWQSRNNTIIKVSETGSIEAVGVGKTSVIVGTETHNNLDSITLQVVNEAYMYNNYYDKDNNRLTLSFSKEIQYLADSLIFWSIVGNHDDKERLPLAITKDNSLIHIIIDTIFQNEYYVHVTLKNKGAVIFHDNSLLLPKTINCYLQHIPTDQYCLNASTDVWYSDKTVFIPRLFAQSQLSIFSYCGQIVFNTIITSSQIPLELPTGYYHAQISLENKTLQFSFVVTD